MSIVEDHLRVLKVSAECFCKQSVSSLRPVTVQTVVKRSRSTTLTMVAYPLTTLACMWFLISGFGRIILRLSEPIFLCWYECA